MRHHQRGMTLIGLLCIFALAGLVVYAGIRLVPVYINFMKLSSTMESAAREVKGDSVNEGALRRSLERHWGIEDITSVEPKDIEFKKEDGGLVMHVAYQDVVPYIYNVSLAVNFEKSVKVE